MSDKSLSKDETGSQKGSISKRSLEQKPSLLCTDCTLLRCKSGCPASTCPTCIASPKCCSLNMIFEKSPLCREPPSSYTPKCPSSPKCSLPPSCLLDCPPSSPCSLRCPPSPICKPLNHPCTYTSPHSSPLVCNPECPPSPLCSRVCPPQQKASCPQPLVCCPPLPSLSAQCANPFRCPRCCDLIPWSQPPQAKCEVTPSCCQPQCITQCPPQCPPQCSPQCIPQCPPQCSPQCIPQCPPQCIPQCPPPTKYPSQCSLQCPPQCLPQCPTSCQPPCTPKCPLQCIPPCLPQCPPSCQPPCTTQCSPQCPPPCPPHCPQPCPPPCPAPCTPLCYNPSNPCSAPLAHGCCSDVESERCKRFQEFLSSPATWDTYGVRIKWTDPDAPGTCIVYTGHPILLKLCVEVKPSTGLTPSMFSANCWTPMKSTCNPCGRWKDIPLLFQQEASCVGELGVSRYVYSLSLTPTQTETVKLSFNITWENFLIWANNACDKRNGCL